MHESRQALNEVAHTLPVFGVEATACAPEVHYYACQTAYAHRQRCMEGGRLGGTCRMHTTTPRPHHALDTIL